ncbi:MAG: MMPL family transporter [Bacteroidales bacterium]
MITNNNNENQQVKNVKWFTELGEHIISRRWIYIILIIIITLVAGLGLPKIKYDTSVENWFTKESIVFADKKQFQEYFGNSQIVAIHVTASDVFSPEILNMLDTLGNELETEVPFADEVISIANIEYSYSEDGAIITEDLVPDDFQDTDIEKYRQRALGKESLRNKIVSEDCTETWLVLDLLPYPENWEEEHGLSPENAVGKKVLEILGQQKYGKYELSSVGTPIYAYEELLFTQSESFRLLTITLIVLSLFLIVFFRSFQGVFIPLITAIVSIIIVFGIMGHMGIKINAFLFAVPIILSLAVSLGYSVHLFNYLKRSLMEVADRKKALALAIGKTGWPTAFSAFTTIGALVSFLAISLIPIRWLGMTSAMMVFVVFIIVIFLTGALLSFSKKTHVREKRKNLAGELKADKYLINLGNFVFRHSRGIIAITFLILAVMVVGLVKLEVNIDTERSYGMKVPYVKRMLEVAGTQIGSFDSYNITIDFQREDAVKEPAILVKFDEFIDKVNQLKLTKKTSSVLDILKDINRLMHDNNDACYKIPDSKNMTAQLLMVYEMSGGAKLSDWVNNDFSILRLEVETKNLNARETMYEIKKLEELSSELFPSARMNITGGLPEFAILNQLVAKGQIKSLLLALAIIGILMIIVFSSVKTGLIGLIPNILPILVIGGTMGLFKIPLDFLTVTIAPMILGIAVDNTIHFINHLKQRYKQVGNYPEASVDTLKVVGQALFTTSFIIIISFIIYLTSPLNMMVYLGLFVVIGIFSAMISNLLLTPIIIKWTKPFGK